MELLPGLELDAPEDPQWRQTFTLRGLEDFKRTSKCGLVRTGENNGCTRWCQSRGVCRHWSWPYGRTLPRIWGKRSPVDRAVNVGADIMEPKFNTLLRGRKNVALDLKHRRCRPRLDSANKPIFSSKALGLV